MAASSPPRVKPPPRNREYRTPLPLCPDHNRRAWGVAIAGYSFASDYERVDGRTREWRNGRKGAGLAAACRGRQETPRFRPSGKRSAGLGWCPLGL
jgi:hypothetical protein